MEEDVSFPATRLASGSPGLRARYGDRAIGLAVALVLEALLVLLLFTLNRTVTPPPEAQWTEVDLTAQDYDQATAEEPAPEEARRPPQEFEAPQPVEAVSQTPPPAPPPAGVIPIPSAPPAPPPQERPAPPRPTAAGPVQGPPAPRSGAPGDSQLVGRAPNGEPLYAARWYREPTDDELRGYLSTATGPGWGLIACRTAPDYRVEDCVPLAEYPAGAMINRAVLAAAWQFKVRPPRLGGRNLIGSWVRIRIDYEVRRN